MSMMEIVVVIAIVGLLIGLILPAIQRVRESAARAQCLNRLHQLGFAFHQFHDVSGRFPPGITNPRAQSFRSLGWPARLLPYLEQPALWNQTVRDYAERPSPFAAPQHSSLATVVPAFTCPIDPRAGFAQDTHRNRRVALTSFVGNLGLNYASMDGVLMVDSKVTIASIVDGSSNTLLVGERPPSNDFWFGWWYAGYGQAGTGSADILLGARERNLRSGSARLCPPGPYHYSAGLLDKYCDVFHYWSLHSGGANFAFCDGSVRFLAYSADTIMPALATRAGGEAVATPD